MKISYDAGLNGELAVEQYLIQQGMTVITRRYRGGDGEIDLILEDADTIVFAEVKARPAGFAGSGLMAVTTAKQRRIMHAALTFLVEQGWSDRSVRFDVVEVTRDGILHIPNAFMSSL